MKRGTFLTVASMTLLFGATPVSAGNILVNPGFETGSLPPWFQDSPPGPEPWNVTTAEAHSGLYSVTGVGNQRITQMFAAIPTALITEVSWWILQPELRTTGYSGFFYYSDGSSEQVGTTFPPNGLPNWTFVDMTSELDVGKSLIGFGEWGYSGGGPGEDRTYLDDLSVIVIPAPGSLALLGLSGLLVRRRRRR